MRKKIFRLALIVVLLGVLPVIPPADAMALEGIRFPLRDDGSGELKDGDIMIDLAHGLFVTHADVGERNGRLYFELLAHNPSGNPMTITWGMIRADPKGSLRFQGTFDSLTSSWIESYGLKGATFGLKPI